MVKVGMDTDSPGNHAGYDADPQFNATGFSQLHDDGTGGAVPLSNFKIWAFTNCSSFETCPTSITSRKTLRKVLPDGSPDDFASPGYFSTNLTNSIRVELTATRRTALHRYTFPPGTTEPRIMLDLTNDGQRSSTDPVMTLDPDTGKLEGGEGYDLGKPAEYGIWLGNFPVRGTTNILQLYYGFVDEIGGLLTFQPAPNGERTSILVRVGVSFISSAQACANAEEEISDFDFAGVQNAARAQWNDLLGRVQVDMTGVDLDTVKLFYSSLYRTHISPANYTGENPKWNSTEPYYDSLYCNIVRGMIDIQKHEGTAARPTWRIVKLKAMEEAARHSLLYIPYFTSYPLSDGDPILGEFFVKFHEHAAALDVNVDDLYNALLADAEIEPPNWNLQGRQANAWKQFNYIPQDMFSPGGANTKQASRTLEHAFNDFSISQVAKVLGKTEDALKYTQRASNFANLWNPNITVPGGPGVIGMIQPRFANGTFNFTDPRHCSVHDPAKATCFLNAANRDGFYEYTAKLVELQGGVDKFISRLDFIFDQDYFDSTDEPSQQIPFMYHYANRPGLSTQRSRQIIAQFFNTSTNGLPGNDDSGAMGSYAAFYLAGLYPLPATQQFLLSSPYFREISFFNPVLNTTTRIVANNFNGNPPNGTGGRVFVQLLLLSDLVYLRNLVVLVLNHTAVKLELPKILVLLGAAKKTDLDSYTDGGHDDGGPLDPPIIVPPSPLAGGRSTNGLTWVEHVANDIGATLKDYAQSAACIDLSLWPSNPRQVDFIHQVDGDHMQAAAQALLGQIELLASPPTNAQNFMVLDVYGRGVHTPSGEAFKQTVYNGLRDLHTRQNGSQLNVSYINFSTIWDGVLGPDPGYAAFGYVSTDSCTQCTDENGCSTIGMCKDPEHYFYWIPGHPSKETNRIMADYVDEVWAKCQVA
ncbi:hypothetical protein C0995_009249 [Termitomyces sp. Mi166|nr:hypothetical protein C0995_009249 [Termitomyces sp. Mi166\